MYNIAGNNKSGQKGPVLFSKNVIKIFPIEVIVIIDYKKYIRANKIHLQVFHHQLIESRGLPCMLHIMVNKHIELDK